LHQYFTSKVLIIIRYVHLHIIISSQVMVCHHVNKTLECKFVNRQKCNAVKEQNVTGNEINLLRSPFFPQHGSGTIDSLDRSPSCSSSGLDRQSGVAPLDARSLDSMSQGNFFRRPTDRVSSVSAIFSPRLFSHHLRGEECHHGCCYLLCCGERGHYDWHMHVDGDVREIIR